MHAGRGIRLRWLRRYLPAELSGILGALFCSWLASLWTTGPEAIALAGTCGENLGYFSMMFAREQAIRGRRSTRQIVRELTFELGPATVIDSLVCGPVLLYFGILLAPNLPVGLAAGTILASCTFYVLTIATHERLRQRPSLCKKENCT